MSGRGPLRIVLLATAALAGVAVSAEEAAAPPARFTLSASDAGGFIRLDTQTGAVSHCLASGGRWRCEPAGEPAAGDAEAIARLEARLAEIRAEIVALAGIDDRLTALEASDRRASGEIAALRADVERLAAQLAGLTPGGGAGAEPRGFAGEAIARLSRLVATLKRGLAG